MSRVARIDSTRRAGRLVLASELDPDREPTGAELAAIDEEWPLIAAELAVVNAEATIAAAGDQVTELDWRRLRRARRRVLAAAAAAKSRNGGEAA